MCSVAVAMPDERRILAAFDFDGTLTVKDSVVPFLFAVKGRGRLLIGLALKANRVVAVLLRRDRNALRAIATKIVFTGRPESAIRELAGPFGETIVAVGLRPDTVARLQWHNAAGHVVVIVSASYEHYVRVVARQLGVEVVLATQLEVDTQGRCTGRLSGANCRGQAKVERLDRWLGESNQIRSDFEIWAYGDSKGDRELLDVADHPVWVNTPLASVAATP